MNFDELPLSTDDEIRDSVSHWYVLPEFMRVDDIMRRAVEEAEERHRHVLITFEGVTRTVHTSNLQPNAWEPQSETVQGERLVNHQPRFMPDQPLAIHGYLGTISGFDGVLADPVPNGENVQAP